MDFDHTASDRADPTYSPICRTIRVGGISKHELLAQLLDAQIQLNEYARVLFAHEMFITAPTVVEVQIVDVSVADLGFSAGANIVQIYERAAAVGLSLCPIELAAHLRLQYTDQPEGHLGQAPSQHQAPPGSLTVAACEISNDDTAPKGFYLRRIEGVLWLRGYCSGPDHMWSAADRLIFCRKD